MKEIIYIIALSLGSFFVIFILAKMMGYRQMSQMSMFDYISSITIGSIAAEMATALDKNFMQPLTAMIVYGLATLSFSRIGSKSMKMRRLIEGKPLVLFHNGELYKNHLKKAKIDVTEFLEQCRISGYFDLSKIQTAVLEGNGKISFLEKASDRPLTPSDINLSPKQDYMVANVIIDGKIMWDNLKHTGNNEAWLKNQMKGQGADKIEDVLLATCDISNKLVVYTKQTKKEAKDVLM